MATSNFEEQNTSTGTSSVNDISNGVGGSYDESGRGFNSIYSACSLSDGYRSPTLGADGYELDPHHYSHAASYTPTPSSASLHDPWVFTPRSPTPSTLAMPSAWVTNDKMSPASFPYLNTYPMGRMEATVGYGQSDPKTLIQRDEDKATFLFPSEKNLLSYSEEGPSRTVGVITKTSYVRPQHPHLRCTLCNERSEGFRGSHELERHMSRAHATTRKGYICVDASADKRFLANCKHCRNKKVYGAYYNAAAHLRRAHFHPRKRGRKGKNDEKRGGIGGGDDPPMEHLKQHWIQEVEIPNENRSQAVSPYRSSNTAAVALDPSNDTVFDPCFVPQDVDAIPSASPCDYSGLESHGFPINATVEADGISSGDSGFAMPPYSAMSYLLPQTSANYETKTHLFAASGLQSDPGYHSGLGTDTASVCSLNSAGSSLVLPQNLLQNFIAFFGDMLIEEAGARQWIEYTLAHQSADDIDKCLGELLKAFAISMESDEITSEEQVSTIGSSQAQQTRKVITGARSLIRRYRPKIARYFRNNAVPILPKGSSLLDRLRETGPQLSISERVALTGKSNLDSGSLDEHDMIAEADEEVIEENEAELCANLELVRDVLVSSEAFHQMTLNLRQNLYHDDMYSMGQIRSCLEMYPPASEEKFVVGLTLREFMQTQYGDNFPSVGSVVVITGSALYCQATTCAKYMNQTWPETGTLLVELLDGALAGESPAIVSRQEGNGRPALSMDAIIRSSGDIVIKVQGQDVRTFIEVAQQLAWITSALSLPPPGNELTYATSVFTRTLTNSYFMIQVRHAALHVTETACWLPLFSGAVIVSGFPIPERTNEIGLEISLNMLAALAGVRHAIEFAGGVVMKGFSHLFVPVRKTYDRIQWHAVSSMDPKRRLTYHDGLSRCGARALSTEISLHDIQQNRTIVGWCSIVMSRLGSDIATYENIDYSGAENAEAATKLAGGTVGFQQFGTAALDFKFGVKDGRCHYQRSGPYRDIITAAEITPIVLFDTEERRAWLVPASDVMLHILQHRHSLNPYEVNRQRVKLDTNVPPNSSAKKVLLDRELLDLSDGGDYKFRDAILNIWGLLEFLIDQNVSNDRNSQGVTIKHTLRESLRGFEFRAVVEQRSPLRQKQVLLDKTHGGWPSLVRDIDAVVLMASGFEDILLPADMGNSTLCKSWRRVPTGHDYMATSAQMLLGLYSVAGCRLNRKYLTSSHLQWHQGGPELFGDCNERSANPCQCDRLQQILPKSAISTVVSPSHIVEQGAVIFGKPTTTLQNFVSRPRPPATKILGIYSQKNAPLSIPVTHGVLEKQCLAELPASEDDDSAGNLSTCTTISSQDGPATPANLVSVHCIELLHKRQRENSPATRHVDDYAYDESKEVIFFDNANHKRPKMCKETPFVSEQDPKPFRANGSPRDNYPVQAKPKQTLRRQNGFHHPASS